jgi:outer membrane immunogenic protein
MKKKLALAVVAASALLTTTAFAADMAPRYTKAPPPAPVAIYNWTGFYIGAHVGGGWNESDTSTIFLPSAAAFNALPFTVSHDHSGVMAGGQIGYNFQTNNWVFGIEADASWTDWSSGYTVGPILDAAGVPIAGSFQTAATDFDFFGTVRGRLGVAVNNWLLYATGGLAYADIRHTVLTAFPPPAGVGSAFTGTSGDDFRAGWTVGAGVEWGFAPNWSLKAEYLYYDLGDITVTGLDPLFPAFSTSTTFENRGHIARGGINYRFGGPVIARY